MTQLSLDLGPEQAPGPRFTDEQAHAIERRDGELVLDAAAGSGKTTVLVERFVRSVLEDGVDVGRILAITFTEKAAAELRDRIRRRLRELGHEEGARAAEGAWISTIHGFCARVVRGDALVAGLDPEFTVLEPVQASRLSAAAFSRALREVARTAIGADLIASYQQARLRIAITALYGELRSRGQLRPSLPASPVAAGSGIEETARVRETALAVLRELGEIDAPGVRVRQAIDALERVPEQLAGELPWPGELDALQIRPGAKALQSEACDRYRAALEQLRAFAEIVHAAGVRDGLEALLAGYGDYYARAKAARSGVDFEDLELYARELLSRGAIGARYRERFERVMVDEMQDTNRVQLELIDLVADGNLFMVGDAQQSIYGFRHADVELFAERGRRLEPSGRRRSLQTNFRSRAELLAPINAAFEQELGDAFRELRPGRSDPPASEPLVELLIVDRQGDYEDEEGGTVTPWRMAEARTLAGRVRRLLDAGEARPADVVVLSRATTDIGAYERALEDAGVPTYVVGGRGYWRHPQVVELVSYLRALSNPLDLAAWFTTLSCELCGLSLDGLVLVGAGATDELGETDRRRFAEFSSWFAGERAAAAHLGAEQLIDRALAHRGYESWVARRPDARRRLANVRKLMRLGREWEAQAGSDLAGFVEMLDARVGGEGGQESEAPVAGEGLDAVRLMTIHRSKGLEFPIVCVADLGRRSGARGHAPLIRVGRDGRRLGLRLGRPGTTGDLDALAYAELRAEQAAADRDEERRLFYVAMTRARERLILSGAAQLFDWDGGNRGAPIGWIGSALVPEIAVRIAEGEFVAEPGVRVTVFDGESAGGLPATVGGGVSTSAADVAPVGGLGPAGGVAESDAGRETGPGNRFLYQRLPSVAVPRSLSYTAISAYHRCGYRFYVERILGLPAVAAGDAGGGVAGGDAAVVGRGAGPTGAALGTLVHELLRELELTAPAASGRAGTDRAGAAGLSPGTPPEVAAHVRAFATSSTATRLAAAADLRREQPFVFRFDELLITGVFDALATEPRAGGGRRWLVVDYKTDRLGTDPGAVVVERYATQQSLYALAALSAGADEVEVAHLFSASPEEPVTARFTQSAIPTLEAELEQSLAGLVAGDYPVSATPGPALCAGCPAAGGLCSHPVALTGG